MLSREAANTNLIVFGLTRPGNEPTTYCTQGKHTNHYNTNAVILMKYVYIPTLLVCEIINIIAKEI
jgi:hypothetical protein